jgi:hypothetical protein
MSGVQLISAGPPAPRWSVQGQQREGEQKGQYVRNATEGSQKARKFLSRLILVANVCEKSILGSGVGPLCPAAKSAPRALHKAAAGSVQNLLGIIIVIVVLIGKRFS